MIQDVPQRAPPGPVADRLARPWLLAAALVLGFIVTTGFSMGSFPVTAHREDRCHDVVQVMLATGDLAIPFRLGAPWLNKPPLYYWLGTLSATLAGGYSLTALRAPSLLSGALMVALLIAWGRSIGGAGRAGWRLGLLAGLLLGLMTAINSQAREGSAELLLALLCTACFWCYDEARLGGKRGRLVPFAVLLALAVLAKATAPLMIVGAPLTVHLVARREWKQAFRPRVLLAVGAALVAGFAWYGVVLLRVPHAYELLVSEAVLPAGVKLEVHTATHFKPPTEHLVNILKLCFPLTPLMLLVIWRGIRTRFWRGQARLRLQATIFVTLLVCFSILPQKRADYLLPLLPPLALLMGDACLAFGEQGGTAPRTFLRVLAGLLVLIGGCACAALVVWFGGILQAPLAAVVVAAVGLPLLVLAAVSGWRGRAWAFGAACVAFWALGLMTVQSSYDLWKAQFKTGVMAARSDYDAARWQQLRERYPEMMSSFEVDASWSRNQQETVENHLTGEGVQREHN